MSLKRDFTAVGLQNPAGSGSLLLLQVHASPSTDMPFNSAHLWQHSREGRVHLPSDRGRAIRNKTERETATTPQGETGLQGVFSNRFLGHASSCFCWPHTLCGFARAFEYASCPLEGVRRNSR